MYLLSLTIILTVSYNEASKQKMLKMVHLVYRHGARSPILFYPNDKYQERDWPDGAGQLTQIGMNLEHNLGHFLMERYIVNRSFINRQYVHNEVYIRSSDAERCLESAETQLAGLYPPQGYQIWNTQIPWQPIPVHTVPKDNDPILRPEAQYCPRLHQIWNEKLQDPIYQQRVANSKELLKRLSKYTGMQVTADNLWSVADSIICERTQGWNVPKWANDQWNEIKELNDWLFSYDYKGGDELGRLLGGPLLAEVTKNMENFHKDHIDNTLYKMNIFSGHDTSLLALSTALDIEISMPGFASCIMIELYHSTGRGYMVEILYRNDYTANLQKLKLKNCDFSCPLDNFVALTQTRISKDRYKECGRHTDGFFNENILLATFFIMTMIMLLSIVIYIKRSSLLRRFGKQHDSNNREERKPLI